MVIHPIMDLSIKCIKCEVFMHFVGKPDPKIATYSCPKCKYTLDIYYNKDDN